MLRFQNYIVQQGDTPNKIARKFGFKSWTYIFLASCNAKSSYQNRKSPVNTFPKIRAGDLIIIPPNSVDALEEYIYHLKQLKADVIEYNRKILEQWDEQYRNTNEYIEGLDFMADIVTLFANGSEQLITQGIATMKKTGSAAKIAQRVFEKTAFSYGKELVKEKSKDYIQKKGDEFLKTPINNILKVEPDDGVLLGSIKNITRVDYYIAHFLIFDWSTPSWWASKISGVNIEEINSETVKNIKASRDASLKQLDIRINDTQIQLRHLRAYHEGADLGLGHLPN